MKLMDIGEVSRQSGLPASTLRYYDAEGVIHSVGRRGLRRLFEPDVLDRLALIALAQAAGFSLKEIAGMLGAPGQPRINRQQLLAKAEELDRSIRLLTALRNGLQHTAACPADTHWECPTFRKMLRVAQTHAARRDRRAGKGQSRQRRVS